MNNKEGLIYQAFTSCCEWLFIKLCVVHTLKLVQNASHCAKFIKVKERKKKKSISNLPRPFSDFCHIISVTTAFNHPCLYPWNGFSAALRQQIASQLGHTGGVCKKNKKIPPKNQKKFRPYPVWTPKCEEKREERCFTGKIQHNRNEQSCVKSNHG